MIRKIFSIVIALAMCLGMLPGTAVAASAEVRQTRTTRLQLTTESQSNEAEGWSWVADADNGIFTLKLDNVDFQVADHSAIWFSLSGYLDTVSIVLKGENRIISTNSTSNTYDGCGIYSNPTSSMPRKITFSGGGSLTISGAQCGIRLSADEFDISNVTIHARSNITDALIFTGNLTINNSSITTNTLRATSLSVNNSSITAHIQDTPAQPGNTRIIEVSNGCNITGSTLTLTGPESAPVYAAIHTGYQSASQWNITDSVINVRNCMYGLYAQFGEIQLSRVRGVLICATDHDTSLYKNAAFFSNGTTADGCSIYAQTTQNIFAYGDIVMPEEFQEITVAYHLYIQDDGTFTIGEGQKITFTSNSPYIYNTPAGTLINSGTLEFPNGTPSVRTSFINNGTLLAPKNVSFGESNHKNFTNNGTFNGVANEDGGAIQYIYGDVVQSGNRTLGKVGAWIYKTHIASSAILTIPDGKMLDASQSNMGITWETLGTYLSVAETGRIVVEEGGALLLPENITQEQLDALHLSGSGSIKVNDVEVPRVTFKDGETDLAIKFVVPGSTTEPSPAPTKDGYTFEGWYTDEAGTEAFDFTTGITADLTLYAKWTAIPDEPEEPSGPPTDIPVIPDFSGIPSGSDTTGGTSGVSGDAGTSGQPDVPKIPVTTGTAVQDGAPATETTAVPEASVQGNTAVTSVDAAMGDEIVRQAVTNGSDSVVIAPAVTGDVTRTEVSIPAAAVGGIGSQTNASLTVSTPVASTTIPNGGLSSLSSAGGEVTVAVEKTGNTVELSVTAGGQTVERIPGGLTLTVPTADTAPGTVAVLVREDGTREVIRKSVADERSVTVPLDGSATVEIADNSTPFADVPAASWAADAVAFASAHELFSGTGDGRFNPDLPMSRAMLAVALHNLEGNPPHTFSSIFRDVASGDWYAEGVIWAAESGIISGYGQGLFGPDDSVTREQLAVMLWRYAGSPASSAALHFPDAGEASEYALTALRWAVESGIINGTGGGLLAPSGPATRAQGAQMLMNFMTK